MSYKGTKSKQTLLNKMSKSSYRNFFNLFFLLFSIFTFLPHAKAASTLDRSLVSAIYPEETLGVTLINTNPFKKTEYPIGYATGSCPAADKCKIYSYSITLDSLRPPVGVTNVSTFVVQADFYVGGVKTSTNTTTFAFSDIGGSRIKVVQLPTPVDLSSGQLFEIEFYGIASAAANTNGVYWPVVSSLITQISIGGYFGVAQEVPNPPNVSKFTISNTTYPEGLTFQVLDRVANLSGVKEPIEETEIKHFRVNGSAYETSVNATTRLRQTLIVPSSSPALILPVGGSDSGGTALAKLSSPTLFPIGANYLLQATVTDFENKTSLPTSLALPYGKISKPSVSNVVVSGSTVRASVTAPHDFASPFQKFMAGNLFSGYIATVRNSALQEIRSQSFSATASIKNATTGLIQSSVATLSFDIAGIQPGSYSIEFCSLTTKKGLGDCSAPIEFAIAPPPPALQIPAPIFMNSTFNADSSADYQNYSQLRILLEAPYISSTYISCLNPGMCSNTGYTPNYSYNSLFQGYTLAIKNKNGTLVTGNTFSIPAPSSYINVTTGLRISHSQWIEVHPTVPAATNYLVEICSLARVSSGAKGLCITKEMFLSGPTPGGSGDDGSSGGVGDVGGGGP